MKTENITYKISFNSIFSFLGLVFSIFGGVIVLYSLILDPYFSKIIIQGSGQYMTTMQKSFPEYVMETLSNLSISMVKSNFYITDKHLLTHSGCLIE